MNQDLETWMKTEREYWESQNYSIYDIKNGFELENKFTTGKHCVKWEPFLHEIVKKEFHLIDNVFTYSSTPLYKSDPPIQYFIDFSVKGMYFRFRFSLVDNKIEYTIYYSEKNFMKVSSSFKSLDKDIVFYLYKQLTNLYNVMLKIPTYRVKLILKEINIPKPEENLCRFDEYYLKCVKEQEKEGEEK